MDIAHTELDRRPVGSTRQPQVQILAAFACFEEEDVVAGVEICEAIESGVVVIGGFCIEFCVFVGVRKKRGEVIEKMSMPVMC